MLSKILTLAGSIPMIGFGIWHFFVPKIWSWYSYIKPEADRACCRCSGSQLLLFAQSSAYRRSKHHIRFFRPALCAHSHAGTFMYTLGSTHSDAASLPSRQYNSCPTVRYACSFHNHLWLFCSFAVSDCVSCVKAFLFFFYAVYSHVLFQYVSHKLFPCFVRTLFKQKQTSLIFS